MGKLNKSEIDSYLRKYRITDDDIDFINNLRQKDTNFDLNFLINSIYFTSNIEYEDSLTIEKTKIVVKEFIKKGRRVIKNNSKEYTTQLVENTINFYMYIEDLLDNDKTITIEDITNLHFLLMQVILNEEECGIYRNFEATIQGNEKYVIFSLPENIRDDMNEFIKNVKEYINTSYKDNYETIYEAFKLKSSFIRIHPFSDGNGRVSRGILQYLLGIKKLPVPNFNSWKRADYHKGMYISYVQKNNTTIPRKMYIEEIRNSEKLIWR